MAEWVSGLPKGFTDTEPLPPEIVESMCEIRKALPSNRPMAGDIFAGSYSFGLGSELVWDTAFYIEFEDYAAACLKQRMSEGVIPKAPLYGDIRGVHAKDLPKVKALKFGFPCVDVCTAGTWGLEKTISNVHSLIS